MKALFIAFDQAHYEDVYNVLTHNNCRGFTYWQDVQGRGTKSGEPHYGSHAWPSMNSAILSVVDETRLVLKPCIRSMKQNRLLVCGLLFGISRKLFDNHSLL